MCPLCLLDAVMVISKSQSPNQNTFPPTDRLPEQVHATLGRRASAAPLGPVTLGTEPKSSPWSLGAVLLPSTLSRPRSNPSRRRRPFQPGTPSAYVPTADSDLNRNGVARLASRPAPHPALRLQGSSVSCCVATSLVAKEHATFCSSARQLMDWTFGWFPLCWSLWKTRRPPLGDKCPCERVCSRGTARGERGPTVPGGAARTQPACFCLLRLPFHSPQVIL